MLDILYSFLRTLALEIVGLFGIFFALGFVLSKLQTAVQTNYHRTIGWKGILLTAWIGTPIHEISHIFFAKIFRHRITHVSLFKPNKITGNLGHVEHSYNSLSLYQRIGNFFIGVAPMVGGSLVLAILLFFLVPNARDIYHTIDGITHDGLRAVTRVPEIIKLLFADANIQEKSFWIFLFVSFCIAAHIAPSKQDQKEMWGGFLSFAALLALLNIIPFLLHVDPLQYVARISVVLSVCVTLLIYALLVSFIHYIFTLVILRIPFRLLKKHL
ncbi:MAG: hypothetical protein A3J66_03460 [Candidatus Magasanikbacteria bacterium RIFCSPHIGHO2_02_FULL_47_14]|uniref:Uncharacterized protein n=1 Tax=Candidatus Magasanikbacteria bacterium RIFCSPHIGHO2_02_FULL_47_14 TaxID=1798680 RepID=A0A1F6MAT4_9BACT|nr:MAG: hypothetical protein A3J66_03460 [Candidatus Magasanikbacteria bacterium RIFCSPHIGHO2_02_FULL_47_14]